MLSVVCHTCRLSAQELYTVVRHHLGAGSKTQVVCKSSKCTQPLNQFPHPPLGMN